MSAKYLSYLFVQLWAPPSECSDPEKPHYVTSVMQDNKVQWTLSRSFSDAHNFRKRVTAERVVRGVARIADRIRRGWLYEIIQVEETIVDTNVVDEEQERKPA